MFSSSLKTARRVVVGAAFIWWCKVQAWCTASALHSSAEAAPLGTQRLAWKLDCMRGKSQLFHTTVSATNKSLNVCFSLYYLGYITNIQFRSFVWFFQQIWNLILHNCQNQRSNNATTMMSENCLVSRLVVDQNHAHIFQFNYCEFIFENWRCHVKWEYLREIFKYLGAIVLKEKCLKFGCKGLEKFQKEAENSEQGCCCQGQKFDMLHANLQSSKFDLCVKFLENLR